MKNEKNRESVKAETDKSEQAAEETVCAKSDGTCGLKSITITDGTNSGRRCRTEFGADAVVALPSDIDADIKKMCGGMSVKTVYIGSEFTTVYTSAEFSSVLLLVAPWSGDARNTAIIAATYGVGSYSSAYLTRVRKTGRMDMRWNGRNFQLAASDKGASGVYAVTVIDAHR